MFAAGLFSSLFPELIFRIPAIDKKIYLTFDDGPSTEITPWALDELKKYNAHATFFCVGAQIEKHPEIFYEIIKHGHAVGNHTMHHLNGWNSSSKKYLEDSLLCDEVLNSCRPQTSNRTPRTNFFRPPFGRITPSQYSALKKNYRIVMWDVLSRDYDENISAEKCLHRVITKSKPGSIVVFHDSIKAEKNLKYVLPRALEYFSEGNYSFQTLGP
jgi:peptidoglycan/xylan/chitin deacetylase (PgdA/CDA1 family)